MPLMLVTLDVSKLSGWLNQDASCRVKMRLWGGGGGGNQLDIWSEARAGRTTNMLVISVTLDVSKLSGWLNKDAPCRVTRGLVGGRHAGREAGVHGAVAVQAVGQGGRTEH